MDNAQGLNWPVISIFGLIAAISFLIYAEPSPKDNKGTNDAHWPAHLDKANKPMKAINPINEKKVNGMNGKFHKESTKNANASTNANATENANVRENTQTSDDSDPSMKSYKASKISCYLVLDVEATCVQGKGYEWPNEIIVSNKNGSIQSGSTLSGRTLTLKSIY